MEGETWCEEPDEPQTDGIFWETRRSDNKGSIHPCDVMTFEFGNQIPLPAALYGFISGGESFSIPIRDSRTSQLNWACNVRAGNEVGFAVLTSGTFGNMGFLEPYHVGPSFSNNTDCLQNGSFGRVQKFGTSNYRPPTKSNRGTIIGAVVGGVVGAALVLAAVCWWLLRRWRAARTPYVIDLQDDSDEPAPGTATADLTPLMPFHHDPRQSRPPVNEKGRPYPSAPSGSVPGYTSALLSNIAYAYEDTGTGNASASANNDQTAEIEPAIDAEAPLREAGAQPPPTYEHVLWVTRPDAARPTNPPDAELEAAKPT